ncbi:MAG: amidohydrolase family protein [Kiritimatiellae bacterium]|nr:amidohydrolase family protein [Kiritimatiellia bacterium]
MTQRIENGLIVDGSGKPGFYGDIVIDGDKIVDIIPTASHGRDASPTRPRTTDPQHGRDASPTRPRTTDPKQTTIDATGCIVSPGFIDAHAHSDAYLIFEPDAPSKISQGITTEINGQCGGSVAPRYGEARLSGDWSTLLGSRLTWRSLAEYRAVLEAAKPAINTIQFVGHNTLRSSVVGYAGRAATSEELKEMQRLLAESLDAGGWGLTTGLIYQPGKYSTPEEVVALAKVAAERGAFYATHMRSEGDRILEAIDEVIDLVRATGIRAEVSHLKTSGKRNWHKIDAVLEKIENAIGEGLLLGSDRYPFCAAGTDLDIVLPDWAQEGAALAEMARFADPATRAKIVAEINASDRDWSTVMIGGTWSDATKPFSGKTVKEILGLRCAMGDIVGPHLVGAPLTPLATADAARFARGIRGARGRVGDASLPSASPGELICRILELDGCKTGAFFFGMSEDNLDKILSRPWIVPGSDASLRAPWGPLGADHPHPRAYGTMPEFYRRVRALGVSREDAIARMTSVPARRFGIAHRGVIEKGAFADIAIWKEDEFSSSATYVEPHKFSRGVKAVLVNGTVSYTEGKFSGNRAGRFLERIG